MLTGNQDLIRDINTQSVIRTILTNGAISRASIASALGLTKATVSAIVQVLLERGLVLETGSDDTKKGRKPILLQINKACGHIISVDLATETITLMSSDLLGGDCRLKQFQNPNDSDTLLPLLLGHIDDMISQLPQSRYGLLGIAIGIHGVVHHNRIIFLPYSSFEEIDFVGVLEKTYGVPVVMENEANLSALGEWAYCHDTNEMLYISVHSGIGVGIIMKNQLVKGKNGYAGELGHTIIEVDGRPCPCGNRGCLEQYASERALFAELSQQKQTPVTAEVFGELYRHQDVQAVAAMNRFIKYMSVGINNLLNTFNPDIIVLNSSLTMYHAHLCDDIAAELHSTMKRYCRLVPSTLQDTSALLGGVYLIRNRFLYPNRI